MKQFQILYVFAFVIITLLSCKKNNAKIVVNSKEAIVTEMIDFYSDESISPEDNSKYWRELLNRNDDDYQDPVIKALITTQYASSLFDDREMEQIDSLIKVSEKLVEGQYHLDRARIRLFENFGSYYFHVKHDIFKANKYFNKAIEIAISDNGTISPREKVIVFVRGSEVVNVFKNSDDAIQLSQLALQNIEKLDTDSKNRYAFYVYYDLFYNYLNQEKIDSLKLNEYLEKAKQNVHSLRHEYLFDELLSDYHLHRKDYEQATFFVKKLIKVDKNDLENETVLPLEAYESMKHQAMLANIHLKTNDINAAKKHIQLAKKIVEKHGPIDKHRLILLKETERDYFYKTKQFSPFKKVTDELADLQQDIYRRPKTVTDIIELQKKEKSIQNLATTVQEKEDKLGNIKLFNWLLGLLTLFTLSLFYTFYIKRKNQALLEKAERALLEQKLLRTQMEPHFIFNTLNTLRSLINTDQKKESIEFLANFSQLLRNSLDLSTRRLVPLSDEIETLESYIELQKTRLNNNFDYEIDFSELDSIDNIKIPPMLIQPFVENSILHGFRELKRRGKLIIQMNKSENQIVIEIIDNGKGFGKNHIIKEDSLSGKITEQRLKLLSKELKSKVKSSSYTIESTEEEGTKVTLTLPLDWSID